MSIAVIGAGYAGLAAAVELVTRGQTAEVFEASRTLGGRARAVITEEGTIDNGQHVLIGACSETLRLMRTVGADPQRLLQRLPLTLEFPGEFRLAAPSLPAPLHIAAALLRAQGIGWREKWAALRLMHRLQRDGFCVVPDRTVSAWLQEQQTPSRQRRFLWEPLCIAALNTPPDRASTQMLAHVLRDSLAATRAASDLLLPRVSLSALFPEPAAHFIHQHGSTVHRGRRVTTLEHSADGWHVDGAGPFVQVIVAVAPHHLGALLPELKPLVDHLEWEPIVTTWLTYPPAARLTQPMLGVADGCAQWLFDHGQISGQPGLIAAVISARGRHLDLPMAELERRIHNEIAHLIPGLPSPSSARTITEKRATFASTPSLRRPPARTPCPGLWLAGDYVGSALPSVAGDYPATLEGAVRSGVQAARHVLSASIQAG